jgi:hypothetical protein
MDKISKRIEGIKKTAGVRVTTVLVASDVCARQGVEGLRLWDGIRIVRPHVTWRMQNVQRMQKGKV